MKKIPAIKFGLKVFDTFVHANDNLIYECFEKEVFHTKDNFIDPKKLSKTYDHEKYEKIIHSIVCKTRELVAP